MTDFFLFSCCFSQLLSEEVDKVSTFTGGLCVCVLHEKHCMCLDSNFNTSFLSCHFLLQAEHELRVAQTEFDRQAEVTRLLLEGISSTHVSVTHQSCDSF